MIALTQSREEFSARRRKSQTDLEAALRPAVVRALDLSESTDGWSEVLDVVERLYREEYQHEAGQPASAMPRGFITEVHDTLKQTDRADQPAPATVDRITVWLATVILSFATMQAALDDTADVFVEWVSMHDTSVRHAHKITDGQVRPVGEMFDVDGVKMPYPGWAGAPIELWINCRCTLRPTTPDAAMAGGWGAPSEMEYEMPEKKKQTSHSVKAATIPPVTQADVDAAESPMMKGFLADIKDQQEAAASANEDVKNTSTVIVGLPHKDDPVHKIGDEQKHVTLAFMGEHDGDINAVHDHVKKVAADTAPMVSKVSGQATLGEQKAKVLLLEDPDIATARDRLTADPTIGAAVNGKDAHPHFVPHMTLSYGEMPPGADDVSEVGIDRLAVWHGDQQTEYPLGGAMPDEPAQVGTADKYLQQSDDKAAPAAPASLEEMVGEAGPIPWHGPLAPEGITSGDGRRFTEGSLTNRPLPLPLTWQKVSDDGHKGNVTIAKIERVVKYNGSLWGCGHMVSIPEADEFTGLLAEFGRYGVSVDADEAEFDLNEDEDVVDFTRARVSSACAVSIPAFAEAWVSLGEWPAEVEQAWQDGENEPAGTGPVPAEVEPSDLAAALEAMRERTLRDRHEEAQVASRLVNDGVEFGPTSNPTTEDGPGWLTHPVDTERLRHYWVHGEGAAKIGWGTPGDFNRCRINVAKYVKPQYLAGYCANRHYDALGFWPGRPVAGDTEAFKAQKERIENGEATAMLSLVASGVLTAPAEWFRDPGFKPDDGWMVQDINGNWACPVTVTEEGRTFGHLAAWNSCHMDSRALSALSDEGEVCVKPPHSTTGYAYFLHGAVHLDDGTKAAVGPLTYGGGHAQGRLGMRAALAHYDDASTVWADVAVGEDEYGIWFSGWVRPGVTDEIVTAAVASPLSGDWRVDPHGNLELIVGHCVNSPGYLIPRVKVAAAAGEQISLVAAGVVGPAPDAVEKLEASGIDIGRLAEVISAHLVVIEDNRKRMAALRKQKMAALAARVEEKV